MLLASQFLSLLTQFLQSGLLRLVVCTPASPAVRKIHHAQLTAVVGFAFSLFTPEINALKFTQT